MEKKEYVSQEEIFKLSKYLGDFFARNKLSTDEILGLLVSILTSGISDISKHSIDKDDNFALDRIVRHITLPALSKAINQLAFDLKIDDRFEINCVKYDIKSLN